MFFVAAHGLVVVITKSLSKCYLLTDQRRQNIMIPSKKKRRKKKNKTCKGSILQCDLLMLRHAGHHSCNNIRLVWLVSLSHAGLFCSMKGSIRQIMLINMSNARLLTGCGASYIYWLHAE